MYSGHIVQYKALKVCAMIINRYRPMDNNPLVNSQDKTIQSMINGQVCMCSIDVLLYHHNVSTGNQSIICLAMLCLCLGSWSCHWNK